MSKVDASSPADISAAIKRLMAIPLERSPFGLEILWVLKKSAHETELYKNLNERFKGAASLHLGHICRRVAEFLGDRNPDEFALVDRSFDASGRLVLKLKPNVSAALGTKIAKTK